MGQGAKISAATSPKAAMARLRRGWHAPQGEEHGRQQHQRISAPAEPPRDEAAYEAREQYALLTSGAQDEMRSPAMRRGRWPGSRSARDWPG